MNREWQWWRDCRLLFIRHWTAYADARNVGGRDERGRRYKCVECGWRW